MLKMVGMEERADHKRNGQRRHNGQYPFQRLALGGLLRLAVLAGICVGGLLRRGFGGHGLDFGHGRIPHFLYLEISTYFFRADCRANPPQGLRQRHECTCFIRSFHGCILFFIRLSQDTSKSYTLFMIFVKAHSNNCASSGAAHSVHARRRGSGERCKMPGFGAVRAEREMCGAKQAHQNGRIFHRRHPRFPFLTLYAIIPVS